MPSKARLYAEVILPLPLFGTFTYSIPTTLEGKAAVDTASSCLSGGRSITQESSSR